MLVIIPSPRLKALACPFTPEVLQAMECAPTFYSFVVFTSYSNLNLSRSLGVCQGQSLTTWKLRLMPLTYWQLIQVQRLSWLIIMGRSKKGWHTWPSLTSTLSFSKVEMVKGLGVMWLMSFSPNGGNRFSLGWFDLRSNVIKVLGNNTSEWITNNEQWTNKRAQGNKK
jgi:hypothetical protein